MKYKAKSIHQTNYVGHNKGRSAALVFDPSRAPSVTNRNMASADSQPRFGQSVKGLLSDKVGSCGGDVIALTRQVLKGSRSQELLGQAARNMVIQEDAILHSEDAGGHPEECGALQKPAGPAEAPAEVTEQPEDPGPHRVSGRV
uniref:BLOC-1-related complex subunit 7 n=1 Tax=Gasterosteus aculeatus aculeatus TaxID=481459 RepID=A0AAQ4QHI7_GASAC